MEQDRRTINQVLNVRYLIYVILITLSQIYQFLQDRPYLAKTITIVILCVISEYLFKKKKDILFKTLMSYQLLVFFINTIFPFLYYSIFSGNIAESMWEFKNTVLLQYQLDFMYSAVHLNAFMWARYKKSAKLNDVFLLSLIFFVVNFYFDWISSRVFIHSLIPLAAFVYRYYVSKHYHNESWVQFTLLYIYVMYSLLLFNFQVFRSTGFKDSNFSYSILLFLSLGTLLIGETKIYNVIKINIWKYILIILFLILGFTAEKNLYQIEYFLLSAMVILSIGWVRKYIQKKQIGVMRDEAYK